MMKLIVTYSFEFLQPPFRISDDFSAPNLTKQITKQHHEVKKYDFSLNISLNASALIAIAYSYNYRA